jgi:hypothetical protein
LADRTELVERVHRGRAYERKGDYERANADFATTVRLKAR